MLGKIHSIWLKLKYSRKVRQIIAGSGASHGSLAIGVSIGWFPKAMETLVTDPDLNISTDPKLVALLMLLVIIGALTSLIPATYSTYKFGRIWTMRFFCLVHLLGWILISAAQNVEMVLAGRFVLGFSAGAFSIVVPLYLVEISETKYRGFVGFMYTQQIYGGVLMGMLAGIHDPWRTLSMKIAPVAVVFFIFLFFIPESPIYHLKQGKSEGARKSLEWLRVATGDQVQDELVKLEELRDNGNGSFKGIFALPPYKKLFGSTLILMILQQLTLIGPFQFYTIWINVIGGDGSHLKPITVAIIMSFIAAIGMGIVAGQADKRSRKALLTISSAAMMIIFGILGVLYYAGSPGSESLYWPRFAMFCTLMLMYAVGYLSIPHILMVEGAHPKFAEFNVFLMSACQWLLIILLTLVLPLLLRRLGIGPIFWFSSAICLFATIISHFYVPDTHGKTLNEIQLVPTSNNSSNSVNSDSAATTMSTIPI